MSWNEITSVRELKAEFLLPENEKISMIWDCPRCGLTQTKNLDLNKLFNTVLYCKNVRVCGDEQISFELDITLTAGRYKGTNDRPLT